MTDEIVDALKIDAVLTETRLFPPPSGFHENARVKDDSLYKEAAADRLAFWEKQAHRLEWFKDWEQVLEWDIPFAKWYTGGQLNASYNCLDRHVKGPNRNKAAIIWEAEAGARRTYTYFDLYREVNLFANALKGLGLRKGDRASIYLPMIPEAAIAMLACARIGVIHSVTFAGFSAESLRDRVLDAEAKVIITANANLRRGKNINMKEAVDKIIDYCPSVKNVVLVDNGELHVNVLPGRDVWYHDLIAGADAYCEPEKMDAEDPLFILYTSGTTGKPKGILHTTGGYMTGVTSTMEWVFDLKPEDVFWCTADVGWITGHSYIVYGPLSAGATQVMFEGVPDYPAKDRFWEIIQKYAVTIFYTAPTVIRTFMKWGDEYPARRDLSSLRLLGSVGEPINPEAWVWYHAHIGGGKCPIVDTWWQTETGMIIISPIPGVSTLKPGSAQQALPGISVDVVDENGNHIEIGGGCMTITEPWPAMLRGIWGDQARYKETYWQKFGDKYFAGDAAKRDEDGYLWLLGRMDDVVNISGHRLGTMEIESAIVDHPAVAESAVIAIAHELKGQAVVAFVTLRKGYEPTDTVQNDIVNHVGTKIGPIAKPERVIFTADLPKTRSGKIMRRLLRNIAEGQTGGDMTTLADSGVMDSLRREYEIKFPHEQ